MGELIPRAWTPIAYRVDGGEWVHYSNHIQVTPDVRLTVDVAPAYERAEWLDVRTRAVGGGRKELYEVRAARAEART